MIIMRNGFGNDRGNILNQRAAAKHVQALCAKTDPQYRKVCFLSVFQQGEVKSIAVRYEFPQFRMSRLAVA